MEESLNFNKEYLNEKLNDLLELGTAIDESLLADLFDLSNFCSEIMVKI